jgi:Holliday junction resolvase RusA-like endonuclease
VKSKKNKFSTDCVTILIPDYRTKSRNKTITSHWRTYQKYRDEIAQLMMVYCKRKKEVTPAQVEITAYFRDKRTIDTSNIDDKLIIDGLMKLGILPDDTPEHNPVVIKRAVPDTGKDELKIIVRRHDNKTT